MYPGLNIQIHVAKYKKLGSCIQAHVSRFMYLGSCIQVHVSRFMNPGSWIIESVLYRFNLASMFLSLVPMDAENHLYSVFSLACGRFTREKWFDPILPRLSSSHRDHTWPLEPWGKISSNFFRGNSKTIWIFSEFLIFAWEFERNKLWTLKTKSIPWNS